MRTRQKLLCFVAAALSAIGCGGGAPACPERTPTALDPASFGSLTGEVRFDGAVPEREPVELKGGECLAHGGQAPVDDSLLVHDGRLANAVVHVKSGLGDKIFEVPSVPVTLDQRACTFAPHVAAVRVCQPLRLLNSDNFLHNVRGDSKVNPSFNFALSASGAEKTRVFTVPEVAITVRCDIHPWMASSIAVFDHPYFAVTGKDGSFRIDELPAGDYEIEAWHEQLGTVTARTTVTAGVATPLKLTFLP